MHARVPRPTDRCGPESPGRGRSSESLPWILPTRLRKETAPPAAVKMLRIGHVLGGRGRVQSASVHDVTLIDLDDHLARRQSTSIVTADRGELRVTCQWDCDDASLHLQGCIDHEECCDQAPPCRSKGDNEQMSTQGQQRPWQPPQLEPTTLGPPQPRQSCCDQRDEGPRTRGFFRTSDWCAEDHVHRQRAESILCFSAVLRQEENSSCQTEEP